MNRAELILKIAYWSAITLAAILKTRSARRLARCLLPAFLCTHIFIKRETSGYEAVAEVQFETCLRFLGFAFVLYSPDLSKAKGELISGEQTAEQR